MKNITSEPVTNEMDWRALEVGEAQAKDPFASRNGIGILVKDSTNQRLIESASTHLELSSVHLDEQTLDLSALSGLEVIVADKSIVSKVRSLLASREEGGEGINPALVIVHPAPDHFAATVSRDADGYVDGALVLPLEPAAIIAQLSLILYAHRAFARRYHSALEELNLNRRIFRSVTSGISVANARLQDMPLVYVNPAFEVMTGYSLEEVQGLNCRFLQREEREQPALDQVREAIRSQREVTAVLRNYRKDGTSFWNELSLSPIRNRDGELTHIVGIQTDVTARVEFEAALRESEKLAAVGRLASSIAHEINNPLESVMNLLYLAQHTPEDAEMRRYLSLADKELRRVAQIATQSLRFYRQSTKPQGIACSDLLESVVDLYHGRIENAGVSLERRERTTHAIVCLESEIRQVLNNLIRNAVDAMRGSGGGTLKIRSREATDWRSGQKGVTITIADTGSGISPTTMKQLFTPFFTTKGMNGTGLGLWISSEIVERHRGRLKVRSSQDERHRGTVFQLFLPHGGAS